jgi:hypothetical protein
MLGNMLDQALPTSLLQLRQPFAFVRLCVLRAQRLAPGYATGSPSIVTTTGLWHAAPMWHALPSTGYARPYAWSTKVCLLESLSCKASDVKLAKAAEGESPCS